MTHPIENSEAALRFILAGNARFTIRSKATGTRFSYRVRAQFDDAQRDKDGHIGKGVNPKLWFVSVLTGADNDNDYTYIGQIWADSMGYAHGKKSKIDRNAPSVKAFEFFWGHLIRGCRIHDGIEVWHEGQCGRCGHALTVPESIASGLGPECASKMGF